MGKKAIILEKVGEGFQSFRYVLWADVPAKFQVFHVNSGATSAYKNASKDEISALQSGQVKEMTDTITADTKSDLSTIQNYLQEKWKEFQNSVNIENKYLNFETYWDGSSWTKGGIS